MLLRLAALSTVLLVCACTRDFVAPPSSASPAVATHSAALTATPDTTLLVSLPAPQQLAGSAVAISADGTLAAVGVPREPFLQAQAMNAGSVRLFSRLAGVWTETATLRAPTPTTGAQFGFSLSLSADGSRLLVSAPFEDGTAGTDLGAARVYLRSPTGWVLESSLATPDLAPFDFYGGAVALSGDGTRAFVGAIGDEVAGGPMNAGTVRVFVRNAAGWSLEATLSGSGAETDDVFASALATTPDGALLLVGVRGDDLDAGANVGSVRVFARTGTTWTEESTLLAFDGLAADQLGAAVALSQDGQLALVGAIGDDSDAGTNAGSVRPFLRMGASWVEQPTLLPDPTMSPGFGTAVALRADGTRAVIGAPQGLGGDGIARVFTLETSGWTADTDLPLTPRPPGAAFGTSLAISADGNVVLVGLPLSDTPVMNGGAVAVFSLAGLATGFACTSASQCVSGTCVDGFCCDRACGAGAASCEGCSMAKTGLPNGTCGLMASGRVCRPSVGPCDPAEVCSGFTSVCPGNVLSPMGAICRSAAGPCDAVEVCTGTVGTCPADVRRPSGTECRPSSVGPCDETDVCDGTGVFCVDRFKPAGTVCNATIVGACDAPDTCTGTGTSCPREFLSGVECRAQRAGCDLAEFCSGSSADCPPDAVLPGGIVCRASRNPACNPMESCDGISASCPADENNCVGDEVPMPMCPPPPEPAPTPAPEPARGCFGQVSPGQPVAVDLTLLLLIGVLHRRARANRR